MSPVHDVDALLNSRSPDQKIMDLSKTKHELEDKKNETGDTVLIAAFKRGQEKIDEQVNIETKKIGFAQTKEDPGFASCNIEQRLNGRRIEKIGWASVQFKAPG